MFRRPRPIEIVFLIAPLIFVVFGVLLIVTGITSYQQTKRTEEWPNTPGVVERAGVRPYDDEEGQRMYAPEIAYRYSLDGRTYRSTAIRPQVFVHFADEKDATQLVARYAPGATVRVYYDPHEPAASVLQPVAAPLLHFVTMLGAFSCAMAAGIYVSFYRGGRRGREG